ncbi:Lipooligosaccharide biosynthesis protein lex-1, partial [Haemophilus influenzae]|jgi:hypothetical protein
MNT